MLALGLLLITTTVAPAAQAADAPPNLFENAIGMLSEEAALVPLAGPNNASAPNYAQNRARLQTVDGIGDDLLTQIVAAGITPSSNLTQTLGRLPTPQSSGDPQPPHPDEYTAAIAELQTLAGTPPTGGTAPTSPAASSTSRTGLIATIAAILGFAGIAGFAVARRGRRRQTSDLLAIAMTDGLTNLNNRRKLDLDIDTTQAATLADVAVLMIDVDHFKRINDEYGHGVGDEVLREVATALRAQMRPNDIAYRYGGEEFCALLMNTRLRDAAVIGERVRTAISATPMPVQGGVSVSVGVAAGLSSQTSALVMHADAALFDAKRAGRNRVEVAHPAMTPVRPQTAPAPLAR